MDGFRRCDCFSFRRAGLRAPVQPAPDDRQTRTSMRGRPSSSPSSSGGLRRRGLAAALLGPLSGGAVALTADALQALNGRLAAVRHGRRSR